jgi:hypothetical protein
MVREVTLRGQGFRRLKKVQKRRLKAAYYIHEGSETAESFSVKGTVTCGKHLKSIIMNKTEIITFGK